MTGKNFFYCLGFIFLCSAHFAFAQNYAEGELLVKYKNGTASKAAAEANAHIDARIVEEFPDLGWQRVKLPDNLSLTEAVRLYKSTDEVEAVQPNFYYHPLNTPNDARVLELYGMQKISALQAWDLAIGSQATVVANIDTGVKYTHEDLAANMWRNSGEIPGNNQDDDGNGFTDDYYGWDFFYNDADPMDENGHGTHTSGTIGAVGNNSLGVAGVNWNVRIMAIKIYSPSGSGTTSAMLINAYNYIRMMKNRGINIRVTNNSYGGCDEACGYDQATKDAIDALGSAGVLQVFAAGNNGQNTETTPFYPASYTSPSILSVAASDQNDIRAGFSNYGVKNIDVAAPGVAILSTIMNSANYGGASGTSMATPHVAGAAALLSSYNPNLSAASLKATLMNTVDALPQWNGAVKTGGRLNVARALQNQTVCNFAFDKSSQTSSAAGGTFSFNITAAQNCDYTATSGANWIQVTDGIDGSGNGAVTFSVAANSAAARAGAINVGGQIFNIAQQSNQTTVPRRAFLDFDGDGRTDYAAIQNSSGAMLWHVFQTTEKYKTFNFGSFEDDVPVPGNFDRDAKTDIAVWRKSTGAFYVLRSQDNTFRATQFGAAGDDPTVTQDFDGDGITDFAVTRKVGGTLAWYILDSSGGFRGVRFGAADDKALRGDFDGDGRADIAVYRVGSWYRINSSDNSFNGTAFGAADDKPVPADYDGDGKTDVAVWRPSNGAWYYLKSADGGFSGFLFGAPGDLPTPGDYDGDGKTDFSVWRPSAGDGEAGVFYNFSVVTGFSALGWGNSTMKIPANSLQIK